MDGFRVVSHVRRGTIFFSRLWSIGLLCSVSLWFCANGFFCRSTTRLPRWSEMRPAGWAEPKRGTPVYRVSPLHLSPCEANRKGQMGLRHQGQPANCPLVTVYKRQPDAHENNPFTKKGGEPSRQSGHGVRNIPGETSAGTLWEREKQAVRRPSSSQTRLPNRERMRA